MLRWNWRSQLSLIHPPSLGTEKAFLVFCAVPRGPPAAATPSPAQRGISRQQKDKQDEELHQPRWLVCLFVYLFSEPCCWKPLEDFRLQVLEILQRLASPATHLAGFLEAAWGAEEASLTYHFNRVHRRLRGCKAHRRGGEAMASPRPPSACSEQTDRHTGSRPRVVVTTSRGRPSVCDSAAQLERITVHIAGNYLCFIRGTFFLFCINLQDDTRGHGYSIVFIRI